ncbi:uncharacterized protein LOC130772819 [Actinidia eriantha]|uniref:uncharacterized protein LOC130772819 n=1 Tax=Actinidia eriantha TaxID=165200 RepID=UPI00258CAE36|nr:uncharacterized protein LOC130772819 [Actinidia eriantha]
MAAIGWYGPLIDLSKAPSHIGDYVQLLVFVHTSTPVQYKVGKGGREVNKTDIQVGDETRSFFPVSIWQKQMGSMIVAGDIVLLQNVKITRFGDFVEARTFQCSSLQCLVHHHESLLSKGLDDIIGKCQVGIRTKEKLRKVTEWVQQTECTPHNVQLHGNQHNRPHSINWKVHEERGSQNCSSLLEVSRLTDSSKATFYASIGEIFLPLTWKHLYESEEERMFISRRLCMMGDNNLVEDLICNGCQLCGSPLNNESGSTFDQSTIPLYCRKSSNYLHIISLIYRPFMLYVWDDSKYIPLLVKNKAAELLFGNIKAESVYSAYRGQKHGQTPNHQALYSVTPVPNDVHNADHSEARPTTQLNAAERKIADQSSCQEGKRQSEVPNLYLIWLILLKLLMQQGKNSPIKFKVAVDAGRDWESGRFEMVSVSMPCFRNIASLV